MGPDKAAVIVPTRELASMRLEAWSDACGKVLEAGGRLIGGSSAQAPRAVGGIRIR